MLLTLTDISQYKTLRNNLRMGIANDAVGGFKTDS